MDPGEDSYARVWAAAEKLATNFLEVEDFALFKRAFNRTPAGPKTPLQECMLVLESAYGGVFANPFSCYWLVAQQNPSPILSDDQMEVVFEQNFEWLNVAHAVMTLQARLFTWMISRLPGFPSICHPQMTSGSPLIEDEFPPRLVVMAGDLGSGVQFVDLVDFLCRGVDSRYRHWPLIASVRELSSAIMSTPEWNNLVQLTSEISPTARQELLDAKRRARSLLTEPHVVAAGGENTLSRLDYRIRVMRRLRDDIEGEALAFFDSFESCVDYIRLIIGQVVPNLVCYGVPNIVVDDVVFERTGYAVVRAELHSADPQLSLYKPGSLIRIDYPRFSGVIGIESTRFNFSIELGYHNRVSGVVIPGSGLAKRCID